MNHIGRRLRGERDRKVILLVALAVLAACAPEQAPQAPLQAEGKYRPIKIAVEIPYRPD